jgi:hypothetical protein
MKLVLRRISRFEAHDAYGVWLRSRSSYESEANKDMNVVTVVVQCLKTMLVL